METRTQGPINAATIRYHMTRLGLTQTALAAALGITQSRVSRLSARHVPALARMFGITPAELAAPPPYTAGTQTPAAVLPTGGRVPHGEA